MAHVSVSSIPTHAFDTAVGEVLTRIEVFARVLTIAMEISQLQIRLPFVTRTVYRRRS